MLIVLAMIVRFFRSHNMSQPSLCHICATMCWISCKCHLLFCLKDQCNTRHKLPKITFQNRLLAQRRPMTIMILKKCKPCNIHDGKIFQKYFQMLLDFLQLGTSSMNSKLTGESVGAGAVKKALPFSHMSRYTCYRPVLCRDRLFVSVSLVFISGRLPFCSLYS